MTDKQDCGHGHVYPRTDGAKVRCGGPHICGLCSTDLAIKDGRPTINEEQLIGENPILAYFKYDHLPSHQNISAPICHLAFAMANNLPHGPEKSAGLRKLLEAKDCFVRALV